MHAEHNKNSPLLRALHALTEELKKESEEVEEQPESKDTGKIKKVAGYNLYKRSKSIVNPTNSNKPYYDTEFTQKTFYTD